VSINVLRKGGEELWFWVECGSGVSFSIRGEGGVPAGEYLMSLAC
jgi:hypothetical protein